MKKSKQSITKSKKYQAQYGLDRQAAKISALTSGNVGKSEFLSSQYILPEKRIEKAPTIKSSESVKVVLLKRGKSNILKTFDAILKDVKNNEKITKSIIVKTRSKNISLHLLIIKLLNAEKKMLKKNYEFDEAF